MIAHIKPTEGNSGHAPANSLKSYATWLRRNQPSLIKPQEWKRLLQLHHPAVYRTDRKLLDFLLDNYKALLRPKHLDYPMYRDRLKEGLKRERKAFTQLGRIVGNDALFAAISSRSILFFFSTQKMRRDMEVALKEKRHLIELYEAAIEGLGGERGAKGNRALAFLIASMQSIVYERTGKILSQSKEDVSLIHALANAVGGEVKKETVQNKIADMKAQFTKRVLSD
jgi:hypothetical protein